MKRQDTLFVSGTIVFITCLIVACSARHRRDDNSKDKQTAAREKVSGEFIKASTAFADEWDFRDVDNIDFAREVAGGMMTKEIAEDSSKGLRLKWALRGFCADNAQDFGLGKGRLTTLLPEKVSPATQTHSLIKENPKYGKFQYQAKCIERDCKEIAILVSAQKLLPGADDQTKIVAKTVFYFRDMGKGGFEFWSHANKEPLEMIIRPEKCDSEDAPTDEKK